MGSGGGGLVMKDTKGKRTAVRNNSFHSWCHLFVCESVAAAAPPPSEERKTFQTEVCLFVCLFFYDVALRF